MAKPQIKNGYVKIANELQEALCGIRISGEARQVFDVIVRKTYGFNKKEDKIAISQFCLLTKMRDVDVCRAINKLLLMNLISKKANPIANIYSINKHYLTWKPLAKKLTVSKKANLGLAKKLDTKDNITKDNRESIKNMKTINYDTGEEIVKNSNYKKMTIEQRNLIISVGSMWCDMVLKNTELEKEEIPCNKLAYFIKPLVLENWKYNDFKELFNYWFKIEKGENKVNPGFCMNKTFIAKFKQFKRSFNKPVSNAQIAEQIKL